MNTKPTLALGEQGKVWVTALPDGKYSAGCWLRLRNGRYKQSTARHSTKSGARRKLQVKVETLVAPDAQGVQPNWMLDNLADHWLEKKVRRGNARSGTPLAPQTVWNYAHTIRTVVSPSVGALRVHELTASGLEAALEELEDIGITTKSSRSVLRAMCALAVRDGALASNPMDLVAAPAREPQEVEALDVTQARRLLAAVRPEAVRIAGRRGPNRDLQDFTILGLATGGRIGELLAIQRKHLNLDGSAPKVTISGTLVEPRKGYIDKLHRQEFTKSRRSRTLYLPESAVAVIAERLAAVPDRGPDQPLFASKPGNWLWPANIRRRLAAAAARDESLAGTMPHTLRRTVATLIAYEVGLDAARRQLGHTLMGTTPLASYVALQDEAPDLRSVLSAFFEANDS